MVDRLFDEHMRVMQKLRAECSDTIQQLGKTAAETLRDGHILFFCGNGGSAADSQHFAAEIVGRFERERRGYPALALTVDTSALTAIANDYSYDRVFERQIEALGHPGDLLIGISTSGNSPNVLRAVRKARTMGLSTAGLTGRNGGALKGDVDICVMVPSDETARIQEAHLVIGHIMCSLIEANLAG